MFPKLINSTGRMSCLAVVLVTLATLPARHFWLADLLANLRMQQVIAITFAIAVNVIGRQFRIAALASVCLVIHLAQMSPHSLTFPASSQPEAGAMRLMTINVLTANQRYDEIVNEIRTADPDLVAIIELSSVLGKHLDSKIANRYPYSSTRGDDWSNFGIGIYSKHPLSCIECFQLNETIDSIEVECNGYQIIATHPLPPMGNRGFRSRNEHLFLLADRVKQFSKRNPDTPVAVMGDFNLTPWSPLFGDFEAHSGLHRAKRGLGIRPTWYARNATFPLGLVLDHVFVSQDLSCIEYQVGSNIGSDHRSVTVTVQP